MRASEWTKLGVPRPVLQTAFAALAMAAQDGIDSAEMQASVCKVVASPVAHECDPHFGELAKALAKRRDLANAFSERPEPAPFQQWGVGLEETAVERMRTACRLPVSVRGALMPDAQQGYGLPIGGVLATRGAVMPYAVGMDAQADLVETVAIFEPKLVKMAPA